MSEYTLRTFSLPTLTSVPSSATSVSLIGANPARKAIIFQNTSTAILYIRLGTTDATATTGHSIQLAANSSYAMEGYTGAATGIWAAANGQCNVTELQ
jgi:hypothetical protein